MPLPISFRGVRALTWWAIRVLRPRSAGAYATLAAALAAGYGFLKILNRDRPLLEHAAWRSFAALGLALVFVVACGSFGHALLKLWLGRTLRLSAHATIAFALGICAFHFGVFALGIAGQLTVAGCIALPGAMILIGAPAVLRTWTRFRRLSRALAGTGAAAPRMPWWALLVGGSSLLLLLGRCLTSAGAGYDARWYHLPLAETYAVTGAITALPEGWPGYLPHMASVLYAWAIVLAGDSALGLVASFSIEFTFVGAAVLGVVPLARALIPRGRPLPWAWATVSLFPAWHLYGPQLEADCLVAAFAPALGLVTLSVWRSFDVRTLSLWATMLASAALVKYTAFVIMAFPCLVVFVRGVMLLIAPALGAHSRRDVLLSLATAVGVGLLVTTPFWLRNELFYGNPVFPELRRVFGGEPWTRAAEVYDREVWQNLLWRPAKGTPVLHDLARVLFTFSFEPHEYPAYNPGRPLFGSLFTLCLPVLVAGLPAMRRALALYAGVLVGIALWFNVHHQDRYLEAALPWMMAVSSAAAWYVWRAGVLARAVVVIGVVLQLIWTAPLALARFPHAALLRALDAPSAAEWNAAQQAPYAEHHELARKLPPKAVLLLHEQQVKYGIRRRTVSDEAGFQSRLSYVDLGTDAALYDTFESLGITHLHAATVSRGVDPIGGDLAFYSFYSRHARPTDIPNVRLMPDRRPPASKKQDRLVFIDACGELPEPRGLYRLTALRRFGQQTARAAPVHEALSPSASEAERLSTLKRAEFLVLGHGCSSGTRALAKESFQQIAVRGRLELMQRTGSKQR